MDTTSSNTQCNPDGLTIIEGQSGVSRNGHFPEGRRGRVDCSSYPPNSCFRAVACPRQCISYSLVCTSTPTRRISITLSLNPRLMLSSYILPIHMTMQIRKHSLSRETSCVASASDVLFMHFFSPIWSIVALPIIEWTADFFFCHPT